MQNKGIVFGRSPSFPTGICTFGKPMSTEYISPLMRVLTVAHMKPGGHQVEGNVLKVGSAAGTVDSLQIMYGPK